MDKASDLASRLIRNVDAVPLEAFVRAPLYDSRGARLAPGTAARKLGASVDIVAPGGRSCPYHFHHAQEELFIVLEGCGHQIMLERPNETIAAIFQAAAEAAA